MSEIVSSISSGEAGVIVADALMSAYARHEELGVEGLRTVEANQFGDTALVCDIEAERAVLDVLRSTGQSFLVRSEEHGEVAIGSGEEVLLGVLDGLDGSSLYKAKRGVGLYGTMFALYGGERYEDYLAAGIMLHARGELLLAVKGRGAKSINVVTTEERLVHTNDNPLSIDSKIFVDGYIGVESDPSGPLHDYFAGNQAVFVDPLRQNGYHPERTGASANYYALLALGEAALVGEATRKGNLEFATAYALVHEAGGCMVDARSGQDIGTQSFMTYGQDSHRQVASIANLAVLQRLRELGIVH